MRELRAPELKWLDHCHPNGSLVRSSNADSWHNTKNAAQHPGRAPGQNWRHHVYRPPDPRVERSPSDLTARMQNSYVNLSSGSAPVTSPIRIGPVAFTGSTGSPACVTSAIPCSTNSPAASRTRGIRPRQSSSRSDRATSDGQIVFSNPRSLSKASSFGLTSGIDSGVSSPIGRSSEDTGTQKC